MLLFLVNWGHPTVWGYNCRENKSWNPFPSIVPLLTSPDYLVIDLDSTTNDYKLFQHNGEGSPWQQHFKAIFWQGWRGGMAKKVRLVARLQHVDDVTSLLPLYLEGDTLVFLYGNEGGGPEGHQPDRDPAFIDSTFMVYRKLTMVRWAGECINVYANKIRQLAGLARFEGAGLERFTKLAFVTGFPNAISIELQQAAITTIKYSLNKLDQII